MDVESIVSKFDEFLKEKSLNFNSIVIGGAALNIMGAIKRETADIDCLDPKIPVEILKAAKEFREKYKNLNLAEKWINNGPESLLRDLPSDWKTRIVLIYSGTSMTLYTLGRMDLLKSKLFAYCDRDIDLQDCISMRPTIEELDNCFLWVTERDGNPLWPKNVENHFKQLKKELGYGE